MTNYQYINNSTEDEQLTEDEQQKGFNKTGVLLLKNIIDKIEYHLYDKSKPESIDINETLRIYLYNVIKNPINIKILNGNKIIYKNIGILMRNFEDKVEKFYLVETDIMSVGDKAEKITDLELLLFENCEETITIKINTVRNEESDVDEKEGNQENESREEEQS
jgi:hypothetical protein